MQKDKIYSDIVSTLVRTRTEANMLLSEVDVLKVSIYKIGPGNFTETLENSVRAKTALALTPLFTGKNNEEVLINLKQEIESLNYISLTIAFEPTLEIIGKLSNWVRQNINNNIALDIKINTSILGGAVIEYKGRVGSFTILSAVDEYLLNNVNF